jgi:type III pantothenate kinase
MGGRTDMLLAFDVGNTNIVLGVFKDGNLIQNWRIETDYNKSAASTGIEWATKAIIAMVVISAVVKSKVLMAAIVEYSSVKNAVMRGIIASPGRLKNFIKGENKFCKKIIIGEYLISTTSM